MEMWGLLYEPEAVGDYKETMTSGHSCQLHMWTRHSVTKKIWEAKLALDGGKVSNKTLTETQEILKKQSSMNPLKGHHYSTTKVTQLNK